MFLKELEGVYLHTRNLADSINQFLSELRAGTGQKGSATIDELRTKTRFLKITDAVLREIDVCDIFIIEVISNYLMNVKS